MGDQDTPADRRVQEGTCLTHAPDGGAGGGPLRHCLFDVERRVVPVAQQQS